MSALYFYLYPVFASNPFFFEIIDTRLLKNSDLCYTNVVPINNVMHDDDDEERFFMNVYNAINIGMVFDL